MESIYLKIIRAIHDGALLRRVWATLSPYRLLTWPLERAVKIHSDNFYRTILDRENPHSAYWKSRYLDGIAGGGTALDFGCGKGRNIAHLLAAGFDVCAIDIRSDPYWNNFPDVKFDLVAPGSIAIPHAADTFDLVLVYGVLGFFDRSGLEKLFEEFHRVLKAGGTMVMIESNIQSHARSRMRAYFGRTPETIETIKEIAACRFTVAAQWYEGYYARWFPILRNLIYGARQKDIGNWMIVDPRSDQIPPELRGFCVLRLARR